jgi:uncharacterized protein with FMN-binding domain
MDNLKDGVYKATANGYHDLIHVEVYITDGKIEKIEYKHKGALSKERFQKTG